MEQKILHYSWLRRGIFIALGFLLMGLNSSGQTTSETKAYTLQQAVQYALQHQTSIRLARFDEYIAKKQVNDYKGVGLPQLNANFQLLDNLKLRTTVVPASTFDPSAPDDLLVELQFGVQFSADANLQLTQLLFDGSFLVGLKAAKTYADLAHRQIALSETEVAAIVSKAYYTALMSKEQSGILGTNIKRLENLYKDTKALNEAGFVEKIDVDRLSINLSNLRAQQDRVLRQVSLANDLLKFQMGMDPNENIILSDTLNMNSGVPSAENFGDDTGIYKNRLEYGLMQTQRELHLLNAKRIKMGNLPSIAAFGNAGFNWNSDSFKFFNTDLWFPYAVIGLQATLPIFTGGRGKAQVAMSNFEAEKVSINMEQFQNAVSMEIRQARTSVMNAATNLRTNQETIDLAEEVYRVSKVKYEEGVGSSLEVIEAESGLREAQTNFLASLYEYFMAKIDLQKASGTLLKK